MTEAKIVTISPQALALAKTKVIAPSMYPFDTLELNQSFTLPLADANLASLQVICSRKSKNGKKFIVVKHEEMTPPLVEVARIL